MMMNKEVYEYTWLATIKQPEHWIGEDLFQLHCKKQEPEAFDALISVDLSPASTKFWEGAKSRYSAFYARSIERLSTFFLIIDCLICSSSHAAHTLEKSQLTYVEASSPIFTWKGGLHVRQTFPISALECSKMMLLCRWWRLHLPVIMKSTWTAFQSTIIICY